jgi:hypothetical protein
MNPQENAFGFGGTVGIQPEQNPSAQTVNPIINNPGHIQGIFNMASQMPIGSDDRYKLLNIGLQLHASQQQTQQQQASQADGYLAKAPDGQMYAFPTLDAMIKFKNTVNPPGFFQSLVRGVASPFLKIGVSALDAGAAIRSQIEGNPEQAGQDLQTSHDLGYFGVVKPFSANPVRGTLQAAGAGLEAGSYFTGAGEAENVLQAGKEGIFQGIKQGAKAGAVQGGAMGLGSGLQQEDATPGSVIKSTAEGAAFGAVTGGVLGSVRPVVQNTYPFLKNLFGGDGGPPAGEDPAFNAWLKSNKTVNDFRQNMGKAFAQGAQDITENDAKPVFSIRSNEFINFKNFMDENNLSMPKDIGLGDTVGQTVDLTPSDVQKIITELNTRWGNRTIQDTKEAFQQQAIDAFNAVDPEQKLGDKFGALYETYAQQSDGLKAISDIFNIKKKPSQLTASNIDSYISKIQSLNPRSLEYTIQAFKGITGIDLSDPISAIQAAGKIKDPLLKRAAFAIIKKLPYVGGAAVLAHDVFGGH